MRSTLHDSRGPAEICREREWGVGTILVGDEGYGLTAIEITAVGDLAILARLLAKFDGNGWLGDYAPEGTWTLSLRDWREPTDDERDHINFAIEASEDEEP